MKKCPFCAEEIQDAAIVCRFCQRELGPPAPDARTLESRQQSKRVTKRLLLVIGG